MTVFTARDDDFHFDLMGDRWWMTETSWFSFCNPAEKLGGWLYTMVRPNIGTVAGGAWIWDDSAHLPWEVLHNANFTALKLPQGARLSDVTLPTGVSITVVEPTRKYRLGYSDAPFCEADMTFEGVMPPRPSSGLSSPFGGSNHFDQFGRVTGRLRLGARVVDINCLAMRDRSWGPRPEHRPKRSAYVTGIASERDAFLMVTRWRDGLEEAAYGFQIRDGVTADLTQGVRRVERDAVTGWVNRITIEGRDALDRPLLATGIRLSGMIINRHSFIDSNGLIAWTVNGHCGHGEDQDMWPVHDWAAFRRQK